MRRCSLRTLIALMLILPPLGAWGWREYRDYRDEVQIFCDIQEGGPQPQPGIILVEEGDGPPEEPKNGPRPTEDE